MNTLGKIVALSVLVCPVYASADALPKPVAALSGMVGTWKGAGSITMGKEVAKIDATWSCKRTSAQFGVLCTFHVTGIPGVPVYEETDLFGYDPNANTYHWYSVTNAGETHDHVAPAPSGSAFQFVYTSTQDGQPFKEVIDLDFMKDPKRASGRAETFVGGASVSVMQLDLRKTGTP
jgi:hypothetical protein